MQTPQITDKLVTLRGEFFLTVRDKFSNIIFEYHDKNLIVNTGKTALAQLLGGTGLSKAINRIAFGTNAATPDQSDTAITNSIVRSIDSVLYPEFNSVQFTWTLPYDTGNGVSISEFGLLCQDNSLFSRKSRSPIVKTNDLQFSGTWKIIF